MFGRIARLPVDINSSKHDDPEVRLEMYQKLCDPDENDLMSERKETEKNVKTNIKRAQKKQKDRYDKIHGASSCFSVSSTVLKRDFTRKKRKGGKLDYRWTGPYIIVASLGRGLFRLKECSTNKVSVLSSLCMHACFIYA